MRVKVELSEQKADQEKLIGRLYVATGSGAIVLCTDDLKDDADFFSGIVIYGSSQYFFSQSDAKWTKKAFKPFYGTITITQEP